MFSACKLVAGTLLLALSATALRAQQYELRVCADPNNLPFSNQQEQGFENKIAKIVAEDLSVQLRFVWSPEIGHYLRDTLNSGTCDLVMGIPSTVDEVEATVPYYRSTYVFVSRRDSGLDIHSFDDQKLRREKIGVQVIGHEGASAPPAQALIDKGLGKNIVWYKLIDNFSHPNAPADLLAAVKCREVDVAIAWGPTAGFFAKQSSEPLVVTPVWPETVGSTTLAFDISMGVRNGQNGLRNRLNSIIKQRQSEIAAILQSYGVPSPSSGGASPPDGGSTETVSDVAAETISPTGRVLLAPELFSAIALLRSEGDSWCIASF